MLDQHDIGEMEVAVAASNEPEPAALSQTRSDSRELGQASRIKLIDGVRRQAA